MKTIAGSALVLCASVFMVSVIAAQAPVDALAVDKRQGDQLGWAVDYETALADRERALSEFGLGCSVVLTFQRCAAYAADQDSEHGGGLGRVVLGDPRAAGSAGGVWLTWRLLGLHRPGGGGGESGPGPCRASRDSGGLAGRRLRRACSGRDAAGSSDTCCDPTLARGSRATGYLAGASVAVLRPAAGQPTFRERKPAGTAASPPAVTAAQQPPSSPPTSSIMNSTNLSQFPAGVFGALAEARLAALRSPSSNAPGPAGRPAVGVRTPVPGSRLGAPGPVSGTAAGLGGAPRRARDVFRDCAECPEMVVLAGGRLAMGRYEVTVGEYRTFVSATGGTSNERWGDHDWFPQTDRHPVVSVSWDDAQAYLSWLSQRAGATYRLPTEAEWQRAAAGSQAGCYEARTDRRGTCPVGSYGLNSAGLSDMVGNVLEWTSDCWEGDCGRRVLRGGSWLNDAVDLRPGVRLGSTTANRIAVSGFRVARTLDWNP